MKHQVILYSLSLLCFLPAAAQVRQSLWFHQLGKEEGFLNSTTINELFQDSEGFTWIGTASGLDRYDGYSMIHYMPDASDPTSLSGNDVYGRFFEDKKKNIWFCNDGSIQCYRRRRDHFTAHYVSDSRGLQIRSGYQAIYLERDSFLWVKADGRNIYSFNIHTLQSSGLACRTIFDIDIFPGVGADGRLQYLFSADGSKSIGLEVFEFDGSGKLQGSFITFDGQNPNVPALNIHGLLFEHDTAVWLSTNSGIYKWNLLSGQFKPFPTDNNRAKYITPLDSLRFLVSEINWGLTVLDKKKEAFNRLDCQVLYNSQLDFNPLIKESYVDPQGNIWVMLDEEGLIYADPGKVKFKSIPKFPGLNGATHYSFRTMIHGADRRIWCSTFHDGLFLLNANGSPLRFYHPDHPPVNAIDSRQINHMLLDRAQRLWIATVKGVSYFDTASETFIPVMDENEEKVGDVVYLHQLKNGNLLACSLQHGIFKIVRRENGWRLQQIHPPGSTYDMYTSLYEDALGSIYVSHKMSEIIVFNYSDDKLKPLITKEIKGYVNGFYEDANGKTLWIATTYGLVKLNKTNLNEPHQILTTKDGLPSNEIQSLALGKDQNLWMGTSSGIVRFDPDSTKFVNFNLADGVQSRRFNTLAVLNHEDGTLWFGGDNGITIIDPTDIRFLQTEPIIQITEIKINDEVSPNLSDADTQYTNVNTFRTLTQPFSENTLSFSFVAIDYSDPSSTQLEYKMEGFDKNWVRLEKGAPGFARYPNLPPNNYTFKIRAANSDGRWSSKVKELAVKIQPPWYRTWWARSLFVLFGALLLYVVYRYRTNQIRKEEAFKRKEAEYKQLVAETETAVLRLQMNPHFIFNSMNSISSYILEKDIDTANNYLNRFARLMRMILKFAEKPFLTVSQELELLEQYLNTEAMRFEDRIDYEFKVAEDLDPDEVILPTMILQPFIENAIWHGLADKTGSKKVMIALELEENQLLCSVQDNGIGRATAGQREGSAPSHESKAIAITRRRLGILEEMNGVTTDLQIADLKDEEGRPAGTKVTIRLPLL